MLRVTFQETVETANGAEIIAQPIVAVGTVVSALDGGLVGSGKRCGRQRTRWRCSRRGGIRRRGRRRRCGGGCGSRRRSNGRRGTHRRSDRRGHHRLRNGRGCRRPLLELADALFEGGDIVRVFFARPALFDAAQPRIQVDIHVTLAFLRVVDVVGQHFHLPAQPVQLAVQRLDLVQQLHDPAVGRAGFGLREFLAGQRLVFPDGLHLRQHYRNPFLQLLPVCQQAQVIFGEASLLRLQCHEPGGEFRLQFADSIAIRRR